MKKVNTIETSAETIIRIVNEVSKEPNMYK